MGRPNIMVPYARGNTIVDPQYRLPGGKMDPAQRRVTDGDISNIFSVNNLNARANWTTDGKAGLGSMNINYTNQILDATGKVIQKTPMYVINYADIKE